MIIQQDMDLMKKLTILSDAAKYDAACTSSGVDKKNNGAGLGNAKACGHLPQFLSRWQMYFPIKDSFYQRMYLQLPLLCEPLLQ